MKVSLGLIFALCLSISTQGSAKKVKVSIYYEALCPYCSALITDQVYPAYKILGSHIRLDLVPYGNAQRSFVNGTWSFTCQHGTPECAINKLEACGLAKAKNQRHRIEFVNCVEAQVGSDVDVKKIADNCASTLGIHADKILKCSQSVEGDNILAHLGERTDAVTPQLQGVPYIIYNDKNDDAIDNDARGDFLGTTCKLLKHKPKDCPKSQ